MPDCETRCMKRCMMLGVWDEFCEMRCRIEVCARVGSNEYESGAPCVLHWITARTSAPGVERSKLRGSGVRWVEWSELCEMNWVRWVVQDVKWGVWVEFMWVDLCEMSWVSWVAWDELCEKVCEMSCELSCVRWAEWVELCEVRCVSWVVWVKFCEMSCLS